MRKSIAVLSLTALLSTPNIAQARGFKSNFSQTITGPIKLEVIVSEDLAHRANNLPKNLSDRGSSSRLNSSFANNGRYGEKEISYLIKKMNEELEDDLAKQGVVLSGTAPTTMRVTIEKVQPNRPTFNQLSRDSSLSFNSYGVGGAKISADIRNAHDVSIGNVNYDYFTTFSDHPFRPPATWYDTTRAFSRFSKKLSKKLAAAGTTPE